jgi:hypothetical protein
MEYPNDIKARIVSASCLEKRVAIRDLKDKTTENVPLALLKKLEDPSYNFSENLSLLLKGKGILDDNGKIANPFALAGALETEMQYAVEREHPELNFGNYTNAVSAVFGGILVNVYQKTKRKFAVQLLQRIRNPQSSLPKEVEQELKDEGILNDAGIVENPHAIQLALQTHAVLLNKPIVE